jgi:crossover junction endodeoxyribonuclease RusA
LILKLPYPISNNARNCIANGRLVSTKAAKDYKTEVGWIAKAAKCKMLTGDVSLTIGFHPKLTAKGASSKVKLDIDNVAKSMIDALSGIAFIDDSQIARLLIQREGPIEKGGLTVIIESLTHG